MDERPITQDQVNKLIAQERRANRDALEAREFVQPLVGNLPIALDSAEKVYREAAQILGIEDADKIHASALRPMISMAARTQQAESAQDRFSHGQAYDARSGADDGGAETSFNKRFGAGRIKVVG